MNYAPLISIVEKNPYKVKNVYMRCLEYLDRAEEIKEYIGIDCCYR